MTLVDTILMLSPYHWLHRCCCRYPCKAFQTYKDTLCPLETTPLCCACAILDFKCQKAFGTAWLGRLQRELSLAVYADKCHLVQGCWIWPSICQRSYQSAELIARLMGVGQNRIIPEYSFLDSRFAYPNLTPPSESCLCLYALAK